MMMVMMVMMVMMMIMIMMMMILSYIFLDDEAVLINHPPLGTGFLRFYCDKKFPTIPEFLVKPSMPSTTTSTTYIRQFRISDNSDYKIFNFGK